jgi:hypothetical protein
MLELLLMIVLSADGNWISGTECSFQVQAKPEALAKPIALRWAIHKNDTVIEKGEVMLDKDSPEATVRLVLPEVRAETQVELVIQVLPEKDQVAKDEKAELIRKKITLYPPVKKVDLKKLLGQRKLVVVESGEDYSVSMKALGLRHLRLNRLSALSLQSPDVIVVSSDSLSEEKNFEVLIDHAQAGALIVMFGEQGVIGLLDHGLPQGEVVEIAPGAVLQWNQKHDMAQSIKHLSNWPDSDKTYALRLSGEGTGYAVAWAKSDHDKTEKESNAKDAFLASFPVEKGRLIICMASFKQPHEDPRFHELLAAILGAEKE